MTWCDFLTKEEREGVGDLKRRTIQDCTPKMLEDDSLFYRFMKARDFNLKNAEDMLRKHIEWRKEYQVDTIVTDYKPPEVMETYTPVTTLGYDKDGDLIKYFDLGRSDPKGLSKSSKKIDVVKFNIQEHEKALEIMKQRSKEIGRLIIKICFIINFDEITFGKATNKYGLDILITMAKMYQDNYPEHIKCMFFINGSAYLTLLFSVLKPFLAPVLQEKIRVYGKDGYQEALLELIDANVLPAFIGGTRTDPDGDPKCKTFVNWSRDIDEKYHFRKSERKLSISPGVQKLTVTRFTKSDILFEVKELDSLLEWEFETKNRDIGFGVYFKDKKSSDESKPVEMIPKQRINTYLEPETGMYRCKMAGTYIIVFDNSYSWLHPKDVFYRARIIGPNDDENSPWK